MSATAPGSAAGAVCFIVESGAALASRLAAPLSGRGHAVGVIGDHGADARGGVRGRCRFDSHGELSAAFDRATAQYGSPQLVVLSIIPPSLMIAHAIEDMPPDVWTRDLPAATIATVHALQCSHRLLQGAGGTIIMLGPSIGLVGASGATALCTLLEAQRTLVKSAARQWGRLGIRLHWIALGAAGNYPDLDSHPLPAVPELGPPPPALARVPAIDQDLAPLVAFLGSTGAAALTGATLTVDGGDWMVP